jgi:hypothetical protein
VPALNRRDATVSAVIPANDTTFLVLYKYEHQVLVVGSDLAPRQVVGYTEAGPGFVVDPQDVALVEDTLLYFADAPRMLLKILTLSGEERGVVHLPFRPRRVNASPHGVLVAPFVMGQPDDDLLYVVADTIVRAVGLGKTEMPYFQLEALANMVELASYPDGRILVAHQFLTPTAYLLDGVDDVSIDTVRIPLPDGVRESVGYVPEPPFRDEDVVKIVAPVLAGAPDLRTGDFLYLTRSAHRSENGERVGKAIIRVDEEFQYLRSYLLDMNAVDFAYLGDQQVAVVVDADDRWYRCSTP